MSRPNPLSFDPTKPENRRGLSMRQAEKRQNFHVQGRVVSLPVESVDRWVPDQPMKGEK